MKKHLYLLYACAVLVSCSQNQKQTGPTPAAGSDSTASKSNSSNSFIPVTSILQSEITKLDSLPVTILQVKTVNKKTDSAWLPAAKVKPMLAAFLSPVIDDKNMCSLFKETKFNDQSTAAVTFMYDPKGTLPDSLSLRRWDVYFDPDKNEIRRVYIIKQEKENNNIVTRQLTWQTGKWAKIVTFSNDKNTITPVLDETKWVWDLNE